MSPRIIAIVSLVLFPICAIEAQSVSLGEVEAQRCEERAAAVRRDVLSKYDDALADLQAALQKAADLEGAIAVRTERARASTEQALDERNYVTEPKALRSLQVQTVTKMQDLLTQLVSDSIPKLVELKRQLTVAGKLDDAVTVRTSIEKLQNTYLPATRVDAGAIVTAETLVLAYAADRSRADKIYKGQKFVVRGIVGGFRVNPTEPKNYQVFLTGGSGNGWVQCELSGGDNRFREEKGTYNVPVLVMSNKDGDAVRVQKGAAFEGRGLCEGWDEAVRISRCELVR